MSNELGPRPKCPECGKPTSEFPCTHCGWEPVIDVEDPLKDWPIIPNIPIEWKHLEDGSMIASAVKIDLGALGEFELSSELNISAEDAPVYDFQDFESVRKDIQRAFGDIILKAAARILVRRGEGILPIEHPYSLAIKVFHPLIQPQSSDE